MQNSSQQPSFLEFLPVSLFGAVLGMSGLSFSWGWAEKVWGFSPFIREFTGGLAILLFIVLTIGYLIKWSRHPTIVRAEFQHPVSVSFFGAFIISLLLLPGIILPYSLPLAVGMWVVGALLIFGFAWMALRKWLDNQQELVNAQPAWILPVVGTLDVPIVGYRLPVPGIHEICLLFLGIGLIFGIIMLTLILSRLMFQPALPEALQPTLLILAGPFALAFSGYESITGVQDMAASIFFYSDLFLLLLFGSKILLLPHCCPFRVGWWAVGFPLVAVTIATFRYASHKGSPVFNGLSAIMLTISTLTILYLLYQSLYRLFTRQLFLSKPASEAATRTLEPVPVRAT